MEAPASCLHCNYTMQQPHHVLTCCLYFIPFPIWVSSDIYICHKSLHHICFETVKTPFDFGWFLKVLSLISRPGSNRTHIQDLFNLTFSSSCYPYSFSLFCHWLLFWDCLPFSTGLIFIRLNLLWYWCAVLWFLNDKLMLFDSEIRTQMYWRQYYNTWAI